MSTDYAFALEKRLQWLRWANGEGRSFYEEQEEPAFAQALKAKYGAQSQPRNILARDLRVYEASLRIGDTFVMNEHFADLVDEARRDIPDGLAYDDKWLVAPSGWMWINKPFETPQMQIHDDVQAQAIAQQHPGEFDNLWHGDMDQVRKDIESLPKMFRIAAVSWARLDHINLYSHGNHVFSAVDQRRVDLPGATHFMVWMDRSQIDPRLHGFGMWSYFTIVPGDTVIERIRAFESYASKGTEGAYVSDRTTDMLHEIRWIYAAMHTMSLKLATNVKHHAPRSVRRRWARDRVPLTPMVRVVTLRRMEEERQQAVSRGEIDWQWQWRVKGHWRNQYYPSTGEHKWILLEDYIKGPADKPLKPAQHTVYRAAR